nr:mechanosensitive ion channel [uncultured Sphingosinicella sp.]
MYRTGSDMNHWQYQLELWLPRILGAVAILLIAYVLALVVKWAISKVVDRVPALRKHYENEPGHTLGGLIGDIAFWLILLIGIMLALQPLGLTRVLEPVRQLTNNVFAFIPNLIGAGLIFAVGLIVAKIVKRIVQEALLAANADGWVRRTGLVEGGPAARPAAPPPPPPPPAPAQTFGAAGAPVGGAGMSGPISGPTIHEFRPTPSPAASAKQPSLSRSIATLVFYLIMIPVTIMALDALRIQAISGPATAMLQTILNSLPNIVAALVLLAIGYVLGKLAKQFIEQLLPSAGFDRAVATLGFSSESTTPSRTVGTVVMVAILIFFAIKAAELLQSPIIAVMLAQVLELGGRILFGTAIILGGVIIARIVSNLVSGAGTEGWLPAILKWSIIALAVAMGLRFMGLANEIVIIAFASIIGSAAIACALAFGLGGRPTAHKLLERWTAGGGIPAPPTRTRAPRSPSETQPPLV